MSRQVADLKPKRSVPTPPYGGFDHRGSKPTLDGLVPVFTSIDGDEDLGARLSNADGYSWQRPKAADLSPRSSGTLANEGSPRNIESIGDLENHLETALADARELPNPLAEIEALRRIAQIRESQGQFRAAQDLLIDALGILPQADDRRAESALRNDLGVVLARLGIRSDAESELDQAIEVAHGLGDRPAEIRSLRNRALVFWAKGKNSEAMSEWDVAFEAGRELDDAPGNGHVLNNVGVAMASQGAFDEASLLLQRAVILAQRGNDIRGLAHAYNNLGVLHFAPGKFFAALPFIEMARSLLEHDIDMICRLNVLNNAILAFEHAHLEPSREFRREFSDCLRQFKSEFPSRWDDIEPSTFDPRISASDSGLDHEKDWTIASQPVLLSSCSLTPIH